MKKKPNYLIYFVWLFCFMNGIIGGFCVDINKMNREVPVGLLLFLLIFAPASTFLVLLFLSQKNNKKEKCNET